MILVVASYAPLSKDRVKLNSTGGAFGRFYLKASITGCRKHGRLWAHDHFVDFELLSLAHKFQVAVFFEAPEQG
jgi:hypothetical protein